MENKKQNSRSGGRPEYSIIRERITDILYFKGPTHGYDIYKIYRELFGKVTARVIYYHLKKGLAKGIFKIAKIEKQKGEFSWGTEAERIYYELTERATPAADPKIRNYIENIKQKKLESKEK